MAVHSSTPTDRREVNVKTARAARAPLHFYAHLDRKGMMEVRG